MTENLFFQYFMFFLIFQLSEVHKVPPNLIFHLFQFFKNFLQLSLLGHGFSWHFVTWNFFSLVINPPGLNDSLFLLGSISLLYEVGKSSQLCLQVYYLEIGQFSKMSKNQISSVKSMIFEKVPELFFYNPQTNFDFI